MKCTGSKCAFIIAQAVCLVACSGSQSALDPAGQQAAQLAALFWAMTMGAVVIWAAVVGLALYANYFARTPLSRKGRRWLIWGGGVVVPVVVLSGLLVYSLSMLPDLLAPAPKGAIEVHVTGHQYWWRVHYPLPSGQRVELANEIHLPVGKPVEFQLEASDVIHSFWIPALGGKVDMIPGRRTRLLLLPTRVGTYRGACAEYCGTSHALMSLTVVVEPEQDYERWLSRQAQPATPAANPAAERGAQVFLATGCGACHTVRGTAASGVIGPELTHVGGRHAIGAGALGNGSGALLQWLSRTDEVKPGVHMPAFGMLPTADLELLAHYLEGLK